MSEDELEVVIQPDMFQIKGKIPDKVIWAVIAIIAASLGVSYEEIFATLGVA